MLAVDGRVRGWMTGGERRLGDAAIVLSILLAVSATLLASQAAAQAPAYPVSDSLEARRASGPVTIDGTLSEQAWQTAAVATDFRQVEPRHGAPSAFQTVVRMLYDDTHLYVGAYCRDSLGRRGIRVQDLRRKFDYFENDLLGVSIDPYHDGRNSVAFEITPYRTQRELQVYDGDTYNREWEGVWKVRTVRADSGWTAEIGIPWSTLRYHPRRPDLGRELLPDRPARQRDQCMAALAAQSECVSNGFRGGVGGAEAAAAQT